VTDGRGTACRARTGGVVTDGRGTACRARTGGAATDGGGTACHARTGGAATDGGGTACHAPTGSVRRFGQAVPGSLPTIVGSFKSAVTREARAVSGERVKVWQRGYWEHVIRDEEDYNNIVRYILGNPAEEQLRRDDERAMRRSRNSALARRWLGRYHP
jgi:hypothetical protein